MYLCPCLIVQHEKSEMKRELWRIEDVMAGLSASKANYKITIDSVQNPGGKNAATSEYHSLISVLYMLHKAGNSCSVIEITHTSLNGWL